MAKEAPQVPEFGAYLRGLRGGRSLRQVVNLMALFGVTRVGTALYKYEAGRMPPVQVLRGLSGAYKVPFEQFVDRLLKELGVKAVLWQTKPIGAEEVARTKFEVEMLRAMRAIEDDRKNQRLLRDLVFRITGGAPKRTHKLVEKPSNKPSVRE